MAKEIDKINKNTKTNVFKTTHGTSINNKNHSGIPPQKSPISEEQEADAQLLYVFEYCHRKTENLKKQMAEETDVHKKNTQEENIDKELNTISHTSVEDMQPEGPNEPPDNPNTPNEQNNTEEYHAIVGTGQGLSQTEDITAYNTLMSWGGMRNAWAKANDFDYAKKMFEKDEEERAKKFLEYYNNNVFDSNSRKPVGDATGLEDRAVNSTNRQNLENLRRQYNSKFSDTINSINHENSQEYSEDKKANIRRAGTDMNYRAREEMLKNARRGIGEKTFRALCDFSNEVSGANEDELSREARDMRKKSKQFIKPVVMNIAGTKYARNKLSDQKFMEIDGILGNDKQHSIYLSAIKIRDKEGIEALKKNLGLNTASKYGQDITKLNSKQLEEFAKQGREQRLLADYLKTARNSEKFVLEKKGKIGDIKENAKNAMFASAFSGAGRNEFFEGKNAITGFGPISLANRASRDVGKKLMGAVKKRYFNATDGYIRSALNMGSKPGETAASKFGRKIHTKKSEFEQASTIGHQRKVDNKRGSLLNKKNPNIFSSKASSGLGRNAAKMASTSANSAAAGSQLAAVKKVAEKGAAKAFTKWLAATQVGQVFTAVANAIGVGTGGIGYIVMVVIALIGFFICLSCSCGVNDLFSTGSPFTIERRGIWGDKLTDEPNESYGAETMYLLDAYLARNYEYICKRGLEEEIQKSMEGENTMSQKDDFVVKMSGWLNYTAASDSDSDAENAPESTESDIEKAEKAAEGDSPKYEKNATGIGKEITFNAGKVSVVTHKAEERVTSGGEDISTPDRFVISMINGVKTNFTAPTGSEDASPTITYDNAKKLFETESGHPALIERYVYDVESHNSIFYTDIDHSIVPDIENIIPVENSLDAGAKSGSDASAPIYNDTSPGEETPLDNAVFDNTKEIISMAITAFDNNFLIDGDNTMVFQTSFRQRVNSNQFQAFCYSMWLKSHYVAVKEEEVEETVGEVIVNGLKGILSIMDPKVESSDSIEKIMGDSIKGYYLTNIHEFGEITGFENNDIDAKVNYITPFNKFHYSPELYHYGLYQLEEAQGVMAKAKESDFKYSHNHKPNVLPNEDMLKLQPVNDLRTQTTNDTSDFYDPENGNNNHIMASKLPILNLKDGTTTKFKFEGLDKEGLIPEGASLTITSGELEGTQTADLNDLINAAKTLNYRYFANANELVRESGEAQAVTNDNSFVYNDSFMIQHETIKSKESNTESNWTHTMDSDTSAYYKEYSSEDFVLNTKEANIDDFESVNLINGNNALQSALNEIHLVELLNETAEHYKLVETTFNQSFYNAFGTNTGVDKEDIYTFPKYSILEYSGDTPNIKIDERQINYNETLLTDCGVQEAYAGSPLLNKISSTKYPVKGNKEIIMSVLEETNIANDLITDEGAAFAELGRAYYDGHMMEVINSDISDKLYRYNQLYSDTVGENKVPVMIVTQKRAGSLEEAKALIGDYFRGILVYVNYENTKSVHLVECDEPCDYCEDYTNDEGHYECNCDGDTCEGYEEIPESERMAVQYGITIVECYPQAEFCGFYLCGGHTQITIMPVTLSMTGTQTLFDVKFNEADFEGLDSTSYIKTVVDNLNNIWDTSSTNMVTITGDNTTGEAVSFDKIAKQNRIDAVEALGDSWEDKYMINYSVLRQKSNEIADKLNEESANEAKSTDGVPYYNSTPSNMKNTKTKLLGNTSDLSQKYRIAGSGADSSAQFISTEDLGTILDGVKTELLEKIGDDAPTKAPNDQKNPDRLDNEYENRMERISRALSKVGKIGYSQTNHSWFEKSPITGDGKKVDYNDIMYKTDCSGFASWVIGFGLHNGFNPDGTYADNEINGVNYTTKIFTTQFRDPLTEAGYREHTNFDALKPGDLAFKNGHVVVYAYTKDGTTYYIDCTSAGGRLGNGGVQFAGIPTEEFKTKFTAGFRTVDYDVYPREAEQLETEVNTKFNNGN